MRRLPSVAAQIERDFERLRQQAGLTVDITLLEPSLADLAMVSEFKGDPAKSSLGRGHRALSGETGLSLGDAYQRYVDDPTHAWTPSTRQAYETTRSLAVSVIGSTTPVRSIARLQVRELVEVLRFLPRNASKLFPKLSPRNAANRARSVAGIERISASNANAYLGNFWSFMNWAVAEELMAGANG